MTVPLVPRCSTVGWVCESWPSAGCMITSLALIVPSSGSVTDTDHGIVSPQSTKPPLTGPVISTAGLVLPTVTGMTVVPSLPAGSATVSRAW